MRQRHQEQAKEKETKDERRVLFSRPFSCLPRFCVCRGRQGRALSASDADDLGRRGSLAANLLDGEDALRGVGVWLLAKGVWIDDDAELLCEDLPDDANVLGVGVDAACGTL